MRPLTLTAPPVARRRPALKAAEPLRLRPTDVDVWCASLDDHPVETVPLLQALISRDEAERARGFYFERDRRRYLVGRGILRILLGRYLGRAPQEVVFRYGPNGKPSLAAGLADAPLHFNVAHSEGLALYAFTSAGPVGVDLELMRDLPDWPQVADAVFSARELAQLRACPPAGRRDEFFRAWTRQEAVLKALGTGLAGAADAAAEAAFAVHPLQVAPGFAAALATTGARWSTFQFWQHARSLPALTPRRGRRVRLEKTTVLGTHLP